jgi:oligoribonuclease
MLSRSLSLCRAITSRRVSRFSGAQQQALVWIDCEMTGLDANKHAILEAACVVTDSELNAVAQCAHVIAQPASALALMDDWCRTTHTASGLLADVQTCGVPLEQAESAILELLMRHTPRKQCALAGSSVHVDRTFLDRHMPRVTAHLHYRNVDVSTISELCARWLPSVEADRPASNATRHRAMADIHSSIALLRFYRDNAFLSMSNNRYWR